MSLQALRSHQLVIPVAVVLVVGAIFTPAPVLAIGLVLAGVVAKIVFELREPAAEEETAGLEAAEAAR